MGAWERGYFTIMSRYRNMNITMIIEPLAFYYDQFCGV